MGTYITNIGLLATPRGHSARRGTQQGDVTLLRNAWVELHGETVAAVGQGTPAPAEGDRVIDAGGRLVTPGLVDAHTHLIFGGWRQNELGQKLRGVPYLDILAQGGGILSTVRATRAATEEQLAQKAAEALAEMLRHGRYHLRGEKRIRPGPGAGDEAAAGHPAAEGDAAGGAGGHIYGGPRPAGGIPGTAGGIHPPAVPGDDPPGGPGGIGGVLRCVLRDGCVYGGGVPDQVLEAGLRHGLRPKVHADEIDAIGGCQLAGEMGAISRGASDRLPAGGHPESWPGGAPWPAACRPPASIWARTMPRLGTW